MIQDVPKTGIKPILIVSLESRDSISGRTEDTVDAALFHQLMVLGAELFTLDVALPVLFESQVPCGSHDIFCEAVNRFSRFSEDFTMAFASISEKESGLVACNQVRF